MSTEIAGNGGTARESDLAVNQGRQDQLPRSVSRLANDHRAATRDEVQT